MLPVWPDECRRPVEHAAAQLGDSPLVLLRLERTQLDRANDVIHRCWMHYEGIKAAYAAR